MSKLRDVHTSRKEFRQITKKITEILINKVIDCLPTTSIDVETPLTMTKGEILPEEIELVSVMRSGDALLPYFTQHFPGASINKILIQRDEETALPQFKYMKLSPSIGPKSHVIIAEPMLATGGTLDMVIRLIKEKGVAEKNIIIACICAAPEGLLRLCQYYPEIHFVMISIDTHLNEKSYIVPGLGDFGDRYFGT